MHYKLFLSIRIYKGSTYEFMARKSIANILRLVVRNGSTVFTNMESLADYLNEYSSFKTETKVIR